MMVGLALHQRCLDIGKSELIWMRTLVEFDFWALCHWSDKKEPSGWPDVPVSLSQGSELRVGCGVQLSSTTFASLQWTPQLRLRTTRSLCSDTERLNFQIRKSTMAHPIDPPAPNQKVDWPLAFWHFFSWESCWLAVLSQMILHLEGIGMVLQ